MLAVPIGIQVLFNSGAGLLAEPPARRIAQRSLPVGVDRREQLLRIGGGGGVSLFGFESGAALPPWSAC